VLPAIAQIVSVLAFAQSTGEQSGPSSPKSAFAYFLAATFVSGLSFILFLFLLSRYGLTINSKTNSHFLSCSDSEQDIETRRVVSLFVLWRKLMYPSFAIWLSFCLTMVFPVFTQAITSVKSDGAGRAFQPDVFIPTAFLLWNIGDLSGRIACGWKSVTITSPRMLVFISMSRAAFIPLYVMCNVGGHGAIIENDGFYWLVQLVFGFTNGWVGTSCMIVAPNYVENDEKEVCGGFMGLCLVLGLATGSVMSFFVVIK
jgi:equilibrative nucleoside transporter 1/2/3